jgi:hypothetical protein
MRFSLISRSKSIIQVINILCWIRNFRKSTWFNMDQIPRALSFYFSYKNAQLSNLKSAEKLVEQILQKIKPVMSPIEIIRVGPAFDSGYMVANIGKVDYLLSGGAGKNIDFELNYASKGTKVDICDPFVKKLPNYHPNITHYKVLLEDYDVKKYKRNLWNFTDLTKRELVMKADVKMLKLDIEGSELNLLSKENESLDKFNQIIIEIHKLDSILNYNDHIKFLILFQNLLKFHHVIHFNGNNNGFLLNFGELFIPEVFELTLLHKKYFKDFDFSKTKVHTKESRNNVNRLPIPDIFDLNSNLRIIERS